MLSIFTSRRTRLVHSIVGSGAVCSALVDQRAHILALHSAGDVVGVGQIEHEDGKLVVPAEGGRSAVHDRQTVFQHLGEGEGLVLLGVGVLVGVLVVDAIHHRSLEHDVGADLNGAQGRGRVGGEEGVAGAAAKDGDLARVHRTERVLAGEGRGHLRPGDGGEHLRRHAHAHLFCTPEQIKSEVANVCSLIFDVYKDFNITDYRCVLSLRDPADKKKYHDDDAMWNHAENALREVLTELGINFTEEIGEAAFYGPKLDVNVKPAVGAEYTLSTCQLDFCLPAKFHLTYIDKDGSEKTPVVLHRAILGSLDRFMAYLIEETKGRFPTWLAPTQVKVLPVSEKTLDYARTVADKLTAAGVRVVLDESNEKIGYKIREAQQVDRVPYMLVLGAKEAEAGNISVRDRKGETTTQELDAFINNIVTEIKERRYN